MSSPEPEEPAPVRETPQEVTALLRQVRGGEPDVANHFAEIVYRQLKRVAIHQMRNERRGHSLQPTELVQEAYMRLFGKNCDVSWQDRAHFFGIAAKQMRQVLIDHARKKNAQRRGDGAIRVTLSHAENSVREERNFEDLEDSLRELEKHDPEAGRVVELKFFGGLQDKDIAEALGTSFAKVRRHWAFGKAFLTHQLKG